MIDRPYVGRSLIDTSEHPRLNGVLLILGLCPFVEGIAEFEFGYALIELVVHFWGHGYDCVASAQIDSTRSVCEGYSSLHTTSRKCVIVRG